VRRVCDIALRRPGAVMATHGLLAAVLLAATATATAHANVWDRALVSPRDEVTKEMYDAKMLEGDTATLTSTIQSASVRNSVDSISRAEAAYREAARLRPREAEPYFRIGNLLYEMHFDCDSLITRLPTCDPHWATDLRRQQVVEAWDEFEKRAPLDPRIGEILLKRAILSTKLINGSASDRRHLEAAARDYQASLDRSDGLSTSTRGDEQLLGNLAETYMMLGRLDEAIATYTQAIAVGARVSTVYGLAVALDRDGSTDQAVRTIQGQGTVGFDAFRREFSRHIVFYVPKGEENYYFALANEAFGNYGTALEFWNRYVASGAHPQFQPRAKEHIEQLQKKHVRAEPPPLDLDDRNW
jgi:tetratricopeptide (TPR) repeat protein